MDAMQTVCEGVIRVLPLRMTPTKYASFFVLHRQGNLMFPCYSRGGLADETLQSIESAGGLSAQLLGDMHLKDPLCDALHERFGAWTYCSEPEAEDVRRTCKKVKSFPFRRHALFPHVEVIPTPGHRPGGTCYLVDMGARRVLFAGDNVGFDSGRWTAYPNRQGREAMFESLQLLAGCEFDLLCATTLASEVTCSVELASARKRQQFFDGVRSTLG
jgi:hydroxyacylglutathione hydrolase